MHLMENEWSRLRTHVALEKANELYSELCRLTVHASEREIVEVRSHKDALAKLRYYLFDMCETHKRSEQQ